MGKRLTPEYRCVHCGVIRLDRFFPPDPKGERYGLRICSFCRKRGYVNQDFIPQ